MKNLLLLATGLLLCLHATSQITISTNGQKNPVLEETTGAWAQFCTDGFVVSDGIKSQSSNVIILRHHSLDGMVNNVSNNIISTFGSSGFPLGAIDRKLHSGQTSTFVNRGLWPTAVTTQQQVSATFDVSLSYTYNPTTRVISATVSGKALTSLSGDYRTNLYIVEDSVTGTGSQYDQKNFYDNQSTHPYFGKGNPIVGFNHMNVVRDVLGGVYGTAAFTNPTTNATASNTYTYTVPVSYDIDQVRLVATVSKYNSSNINDNEIQNAVETNSANLPCAYQVPEVQICVVTTDTTTGKNLIVWEKSGIKHAKEYKIYRETSTPGTYQHIGTKASNQFSTFEDVNSNPQAQSYKYKLTVVDSCNREMPLDSSDAHQTVHVSFNVLSNNTIYISWIPYVGKPYTTYTIKRSNNNGPFVQIAQVGSSVTNYNDTNPPSGVNSYRVEIQVPGGCTPTAKTTAYNTIISNAAVAWHTGVGNIESYQKLNIYPNPANNMINIDGVEQVESISISDITGRVIKTVRLINGRDNEVNVADLPSGTYIIRAIDKDGFKSMGKFQKM